MYCKKCGKFIGSDAAVCDECKRNEAPLNGNAPYPAANPYGNTGFYQQPMASQDTSAINLGKAIVAIILATVGFIFVYAGMLTIWFPVVGVLAGIVCIVLGLAPTIIGLIFGIQSIANFKQTGYIKSGKRIPVLILGIAAVVNSAISLFCSLILFALAGMM